MAYAEVHQAGARAPALSETPDRETMMATATQTTVTLRNTFHESSVRVRGEATTDQDGRPAVRISEGSKRRAQRELCGIKECCCGNHGPHFEPDGNPSEPTTWVVRGE